MFQLFILTFIPFRVLDVIDIILVAFLLYQIYMLIRGTVAINIFIGIFVLYMIWLIVKVFNMELLSSILGQIIGVGVIALIIVFQQEIRRFLLYIGTRYLSRNRFSIENWLFPKQKNLIAPVNIEAIVKACRNMSQPKLASSKLLFDNALKMSSEGDLSGALEIYQTIQKLEPSFTEAHANGAYMAFELGDKDLALKMLKDTVKLEPRHFAAWQGIGTLLDAKNDINGAKAAYENAIFYNPNLDAAKRALFAIETNTNGIGL